MKKKKAKAAKKKVNQTPSPPPETEEDRFDYGGLPQRDLKKNLGCG